MTFSILQEDNWNKSIVSCDLQVISFLRNKTKMGSLNPNAKGFTPKVPNLQNRLRAEILAASSLNPNAKVFTSKFPDDMETKKEHARKVCYMNKLGYCEAGEWCQKIHLREVCSNKACLDMECNKSHQPPCRPFTQYGRCDITNCSSPHRKPRSFDEVEEYFLWY